MKPRECKFAKSDMTPCVIRDGPICYAIGDNDQPICVGCERPPSTTNVPPPADWTEKVARVRAEDEKRHRARLRDIRKAWR
jgi:hypothetical protein